MGNDFDVVIVGGGPAGASAARAAVSCGLRTLLIEKQKIPRHKICSGMLMPEVIDLLKERFSDLPTHILSEPAQSHTFRFHFDSGRFYDMPMNATIVERGEFDQWLCKQSGAEVRDETELIGFEEKRGGVGLYCRNRTAERFTISSSVLIAADGARSAVAHSIDPGRRGRIVWYTVAQYCYRGTADLDPGYFHVFASRDLCFFPAAYWKNGALVVDTSVPAGHAITRERERFIKYLAMRHAFAMTGIAQKAGGMWAMPARKGRFALGTNRVLLAGDAAGFTRFLGEGITSAIRTGSVAARAALDGLGSGCEPGDAYRRHVRREMQISQADFSFITQLKRYLSGFGYNTWSHAVCSIPELLRFSRNITRLERTVLQETSRAQNAIDK